MGGKQYFQKLLERIRKILVCERRNQQQQSQDSYRYITICQQNSQLQSTGSDKSVHKLETIKEQSNDYEITFGTEEDDDKKGSKFMAVKKPIQKQISSQLFTRVHQNQRNKTRRLFQVNNQQQVQSIPCSDQQQKTDREILYKVNRQKIFADQLKLIQRARQEDQNKKQINILDLKDSQVRKQPIQIHSEIQKMQDQVYKIQFLSKLKFGKINKDDERRNQSVDYSRLDLTDIKNQMSSAQNSQQSLEELVDFIR